MSGTRVFTNFVDWITLILHHSCNLVWLQIFIGKFHSSLCVLNGHYIACPIIFTSFFFYRMSVYFLAVLWLYSSLLRAIAHLDQLERIQFIPSPISLESPVGSSVSDVLRKVHGKENRQCEEQYSNTVESFQRIYITHLISMLPIRLTKIWVCCWLDLSICSRYSYRYKDMFNILRSTIFSKFVRRKGRTSIRNNLTWIAKNRCQYSQNISCVLIDLIVYNHVKWEKTSTTTYMCL